MRRRKTMSDQEKDFKRLYMSELVTALVVGSLLYMTSKTNGLGFDLRLYLPCGLLIFIILQNAGYWYYRQQQKSNPGGDYRWVIPTFSRLKRINPFLLVIYPLYLIGLLLFYRPALWAPVNIFGLLLYGFSIVEYFNCYYFSFQLANLKEKAPTDLNLEIQDFLHSR